MNITTEGTGFHRRRFAESDGEKVSSLHVFDLEMRLGPAVVRTGGIGGVETPWRHRRKGYARALMEDTTGFLKEEGFDAALLFGIERFYHKFGYAPCMAEVLGEVRTRDAEEAVEGKERLSARDMRETDLPAIIDLYNAANADRPLSIVRRPSRFTRFRQGSSWRTEAAVKVLEGHNGRFAGYFVCDAYPEATTICDAQTREPAVMWSVLAEAAQIAVERRDGTIAFALPSDHPLMSLCRQVGCTVELRYRSTGGAMGRIVNQETFLSKLVEAANERTAAPFDGRLSVTAETELGATTVSIPAAADASGIVRCSHMVLFQVLTGFRDPGEVLISPGTEMDEGALAFLEALKPVRGPYVYGPDHF